jgi:hypothetical protein
MENNKQKSETKPRGKPGHYVVLALKYKPEFDRTGGNLVKYKNPHWGTPKSVQFAIAQLMKLAGDRVLKGMVWQVMMFYHTDFSNKENHGTKILEWKENEGQPLLNVSFG